MIQVEPSIRHLQDINLLNSLNRRSRDILARAINLSQGTFSLIIVNCNYRCLRQKILTALASKTGLNCREISWTDSGDTLYAKLQNLLRENPQEILAQIPALMCLGLEETRNGNLENLFLNANLFRDRLKQQLKCPVVLWLSDRQLEHFLLTAPELANFAAPPIKFNFSSIELNRRVHQQVARLLDIAENPQIPFFLQDLKIDSDRESFSYRELELARRELRIESQQIFPALEAKLDFALGRLLCRSSEALANEVHQESQGEVHSVSQIYYQCSLAYWQSVNQQIESGIILFYLGSLWWNHAFTNRRQTQSSWIKAKQFFEEAIAAFRQANRTDLVAKYSRFHSEVLERLNQWQELEQSINLLLPWHRQKPLELAQDYGYLAKIAVERKDWLEVEQYSRKALSTLDAILGQEPTFENDDLARCWLRAYHTQLCQYRLLLSQSYLQLRKLQAASSLIELAIANFNCDDNSQLYCRLLNTFHDIAFAQGRYLQAFQSRQKQRSLEQQFGLIAFIGAGILQPKQILPSSSITELDASKFDVNAIEIAASGRTHDVEFLVARILSVEHQLTVIHGESGVGKSSLVNAGLIPALLQRSLTGQELIPIKIRSYTDWLNAISLQLYLSQTNTGQSSAIHEYPDRRKNGDREATSLLHRLKQLTAQGTQIVLIFDQFEEFFFTCTQLSERQVFIHFWQSCLKISCLKLVISIREDYLHLLLELESDHAEIDILSRNFRYTIGNLSPSEAQSVIENLTENANFLLEPTLVDQLVRDLAGDRGYVRPIELQLVGSQLQTHNLTTLAAYHAAGAKQRLVEQSVEEVIKDCGTAAFIAQQVLILLTDEQGKRPLRTYNELWTSLLPHSSNTVDLDLVLEILTGSGLVFKLPEVDSNRYQLVHDYLVPFIRINQEPGLQAELQKVRSTAQRSQHSLDRLTKFGLVGTALGLLVMAGLASQANSQRRLAQFGEIEALTSSAQSNFLLNRQLESLTTAIQAAKKLNVIDAGADKNKVTQLTFQALQTIVYNIHERYRFNPIKMDSPSYVAKFSPDGNLLAFGGFDGSVYLFQTNGKPISRLIGLQAREIRGLSFSPDSKRIASTGQGKSVRIWNVETGKLISKFYGHQNHIFKVSFHPQGKMLLTGSNDGTAKLWDSDRGVELATFKPPNQNNQNNQIEPIQDASFSPDGNWIITAQNKTISLWDLQGNLLDSAIAHDQKIYSVRFHPDGKQLASSGGDETVKLWQIIDPSIQRSALEPQTPKHKIQLVRVFKSNATDILSLNFSADGKRIAFGGQDNSIQILNLDGAIEMKLGGHTNSIFDVNFSPNGRYLLSASKDSTVRLWDARSIDTIDTFYGHTSNVWAVSFIPDGKIFASGSVDKSVRLWNVDGTFRQELKGHEDTVYGVSFSADGTKLVSASKDKTVRIWDSQTGKLLHLLNIHGAGLIYATFSPDQKILATLGWDNKIKLWQWDNTDNPKLLQVLDGHTQTVWAIAFSPDSQSLVSTSNDQTVKIWNVQNGQNRHTMQAHLYGGLAIAYSPDGKQIASAGKDGKLKLWNAQTGLLEQVIIVGDGSWIYGISFSPDGKAIATANADKTVKIIDLASGEFLKTSSGHTAEVYAVSYSPNGKNIVSASRDNTLKLWNAETLNLDALVQRGCALLDNYLEYTPTLPRDQKQICK